MIYTLNKYIIFKYIYNRSTAIESLIITTQIHIDRSIHNINIQKLNKISFLNNILAHRNISIFHHLS